jgi:type II secretory pathway pseudopilin PulG
MIYQVARNGVQLGQFSEQQIRAGLKNGSILESDLAWGDGMIAWQPVSAILAMKSRFGRGGSPMAPSLPARASGLATWSLVLGIFSFIASCLTGIPAIICGHVALSRIKRSGGSESGSGRAMAGLIMGYLTSVGIVPIAILASLAVPAFSKIQEKANQTKAMNNARQIIIGLKLYAADNNGEYPDKLKNGSSVTDSNTAFRELFINGQLQDEHIFGCPGGLYVPDGNIGSPPEYREALTLGENHWAMTRGLTGLATGGFPLIFENTSSGTHWPPTWNSAIAGRPLPSRAWPGGKIIIGFNDGSVDVVRLQPGPSEHASPMPKPDGTPVFPTAPGNLGVLNPE